MNVVDSSAWLEYFADGPNAEFFAKAIEDISNLLVPTICVTEVFRRVLQQRDEDSAIQSVALMQQGEIVPLDSAIAMTAGKLGNEHKLPLADSIVYATAFVREATVWTQDRDFEKLANVKFKAKKK